MVRRLQLMEPERRGLGARLAEAAAGLRDGLLRDNKVLPPVLAALALIIFAWLLAGVIIGDQDGEERVARQAAQPSVVQAPDAGGASDTPAPGVENRDNESLDVYESKDPFRELIPPADAGGDAGGDTSGDAGSDDATGGDATGSDTGTGTDGSGSGSGGGSGGNGTGSGDGSGGSGGDDFLDRTSPGDSGFDDGSGSDSGGGAGNSSGSGSGGGSGNGSGSGNGGGSGGGQDSGDGNGFGGSGNGSGQYGDGNGDLFDSGGDLGR